MSPGWARHTRSPRAGSPPVRTIGRVGYSYQRVCPSPQGAATAAPHPDLNVPSLRSRPLLCTLLGTPILETPSPDPAMLLSHLLLPISAAHVAGADLRVGRVTDRDEEVGAGDVFVAIRGAHVDGHDRVAALAHAGAVVVEHKVQAPKGVTVVTVSDTRAALPILAARRLDDPGAAMAVIAITGTNGKTSTTYLIEAMAVAAGWKVGIIGTTGHFIDGVARPASHTTPSAPVIQGLLAEMRDAGCKIVAMETSSIGLAARRCDAIPFRAAIFTNLTRDHLDYHGTMDAYAAAKARLFHECLAGTAVLNARDPASAQMVPENHPTWWFGGRDIDVDGLVLSATGAVGHFRTPSGEFDGRLQLLGAHSVENALGALGGALAVGVPLDACAAGMANLRCVPGRLEPVPNGRGITVLVDYAHTDDALTRVLASLRALHPRRILTVFGCGGDRDRGKRPLMGRASARGSDLSIVTTDNPRSEDPATIAADILNGVGAAPHFVELDRARAISRAIALAEPGDIVLIAGKGHEATMEKDGVKVAFDDRVVAAEALGAA